MIDFVKQQEAGGEPGGFLATPKPVLEAPQDGNTHQIGYGHSITSSSPYFKKAITQKEALALLESDLIKAQGIAKRIFDDNVGSGKFDRLSESQ